ncbi:MAG: exodeoxyribonuclease VII small subunit [Spirochaetes bacterium]|nr:exodeoxyribonuclease VII small subunit [Spirochaetota bacterium]
MNKKEPGFEQAMKRLEDIVSKLESDNFDLDKSIELFEEGIKLSKFCKKKLEEAEQKIEVILKRESENNKNDGPDSQKDYDIKPLF